MVRWAQHVPREKVTPSFPDSPHRLPPQKTALLLVQVKGQAAMVRGEGWHTTGAPSLSYLGPC